MELVDRLAPAELPPLDYDEYVQCYLNASRWRAWRVKTLVDGLKIGSGGAGPIEYYELFTTNRDQASSLLGLSRLDEMMRRR